MENGANAGTNRTFLVRVWRPSVDYDCEDAPALCWRFPPTMLLVDFISELRDVWIGGGLPFSRIQEIYWPFDAHAANAAEAQLDPYVRLEDVGFFLPMPNTNQSSNSNPLTRHIITIYRLILITYSLVRPSMFTLCR